MYWHEEPLPSMSTVVFYIQRVARTQGTVHSPQCDLSIANLSHSTFNFCNSSTIVNCPSTQPCYGKVSETQLLGAVLDKTLFGFLEMDIHVPTHLQKHFEAMLPLFCNIDVHFEDIGDFMQSYVRQQGMSEKPGHLLLSVIHATKILLLTPYMHWLRTKGFKSLESTRWWNTPQQVFYKLYVPSE